MFAVVSTGMKEALLVLDMLDDGHYDVPFEHGGCDIFGLDGPKYLGGWEGMKAYIPKLVEDDREGKRRHLGEGPCRECRPLHPKLFICIGNSEPREKGVLVCRMDWDGVVEGTSEGLLEEIGGETQVESKRVGVAFALAVAASMAAE